MTIPTPITDRVVDSTRMPTYRVGEVASFYLGKTAAWMRWAEGKGYLDDGELPIGVTKWQGEPGGPATIPERRYDLREVEMVVSSLLSHGAISDRHAALALEVVISEARLYSLFHDPYEYEGKVYSLTSADVAEVADMSPTWVRANAVALGGISRRWEETSMVESWRFPEKGLDERIYEVKGEA